MSLNSMIHTTSVSTSKQILNCRRIEANESRVFRVHDGDLRAPNAPPTAFFSLALNGEPLQRVSFHPKFAEPGELVKSLFIDLNTFLKNYRNPPVESDLDFSTLLDDPFVGRDSDSVTKNVFGQEPVSKLNSGAGYRLYLINCAPTGKRKRSPLRVTLLFAREQDWEWCEERQFIELDLLDNPLLFAQQKGTETIESSSNFDADDVDGIVLPESKYNEYSWRVASRFHSRELGLRDVRVIVAVANGVDVSNGTGDIGHMDVAHSFSVRL